MKMLSIGALTKHYTLPNGAPVHALGPFDLTVGNGEFVCIVGPSGCGKSTLLRLIAGLEPPTQGQIRLGDDAGTPCMVFQGDSAFPWMTVHDNVGFGLRMRGLPWKERDEAVARMLAVVGLGAFAGAYPHQLSGGMRQRVALARAWANNSRVLLMDEPFGALDEQTRLALQTELLRLWELETGAPKTILFITHSIDEALTLADRVLVMSDRPGVLKREFAVPFPRPRNPIQLRRNPQYGELNAEIWETLGNAELKRQNAA